MPKTDWGSDGRRTIVFIFVANRGAREQLHAAEVGIAKWSRYRACDELWHFVANVDDVRRNERSLDLPIRVCEQSQIAVVAVLRTRIACIAKSVVIVVIDLERATTYRRSYPHDTKIICRRSTISIRDAEWLRIRQPNACVAAIAHPIAIVIDGDGMSLQRAIVARVRDEVSIAVRPVVGYERAAITSVTNPIGIGIRLIGVRAERKTLRWRAIVCTIENPVTIGIRGECCGDQV
jgi:hypothetical protein